MPCSQEAHSVKLVFDFRYRRAGSYGVFGCAAGSLRPALARALSSGNRPHALATVFAGQDIEATDRARQLFIGFGPSSPAAALFKDGLLVMMLERHQIQGRPPGMLAEEIASSFERICGEGAAV